jgi:hypothetical protein
MEEESKGLLAIWADIDAAYHLEFEKWHNCEHMTDRVTIPGFQVGYRYQGIGASPYSLMAYETTDPSVLESEPYLHSKNNPTPWACEALSHYRNTERMIYNLVASVGKRPAIQAPYLFCLRFDPESENEAETVKEVQEGFLGRIAVAPAVGRARLYRVDEKISDIVTEERKIYGVGPKRRQRFLALVEMTSALLPEKDVCRDLCRQDHQGGKRVNMIKNISEERYWLRFVMQAPANLR